MQYPRLNNHNMGQFLFCCFLTFLLCLTLSSLSMALDVWDYVNWGYTYQVDPWAVNLTSPLETMAPLQGRLGIQSQAPEGVQVMSARNMHVLYNFWAAAVPDYWKYLRPGGQSGQKSPNPIGDQVVWVPTASSAYPLPFWGNRIVWLSTAASGRSPVYWFPEFSATSPNVSNIPMGILGP